MPMIDVYAVEGTFSDRKTLAQNLAAAVMRWEEVPPISLFKDNTAAFVHDLPSDAISNVSGTATMSGSRSSLRSAYSLAPSSSAWSGS